MAQQLLSEPKLASALDENIAACWRAVGLMPGAELRDTSTMLSVITGLPTPSFNAVVRARLDPVSAEAEVAGALAGFRQRGVPMLWLVGPTSRPATHAELLLRNGLEHIGDEPGMVVDLNALPDAWPVPKGLVVERVDDAAALRDWCGFAGDPAMSQLLLSWLSTAALGERRAIINYLGRLDSRPVATASLVLAAGVAGIYNVATLPDVRRRGVGTQLTLRPLRDARAAGYRFGVLHSSQLGLELYQRLGFRQICTIGQYVDTTTIRV
jgi:ribosomal protein S18 acetylase RimI-like enzyme